MHNLIQFLEFLQPYGGYSYGVMFVILIACGFGFPMPEDVVLISAGILSSHGVTQYGLVTGVCLLGVLMGDGIVFSMGRHFGPAIKSKTLFRKVLNERRDAQVQKIIHKYGDKVVFMARFMPGLRTPIFLTCGTYQVRPWKFILLDGMAAMISVPLWIYVGLVFGQNLEELERKVHQFQFGIYGVLLAIILLIVTGNVVKKRAMKNVAVE